MIAANILGLIGRGEIIRLSGIEQKYGSRGRIFALCEMNNPSGSVKDRAALAIVRKAIREGKIKPGSTVVEATSGNMGISLAMLGSIFGYRTVIAMPGSASHRRREIIVGYSAELMLVDGDMTASVARAREVALERGGFFADQFNNRASLTAHYLTTAVDILHKISSVDIFVAGVGSGGTLIGAGRRIKISRPSARICAVEPSSSAVLSGGTSGSHGIEGIGAGFVPPLYDPGLIDSIIRVDEDEVREICLLFPRVEGLRIGLSSGANIAAAIRLSRKKDNEGKNIVTILPDGGEKYQNMAK